MANVVRRAFVAPALFLFLIVVEKITVLYLPADWLLGTVHVFGGAPVAFGLALLFFGWRAILAVPVRASWSRSALLVHAIIIACLLTIQLWYRRVSPTLLPQSTRFHAMAVVWTALIPLAVVSLLLAFIPLRSIKPLVRRLALPAFAAALVTTLVLLARRIGDQAWGTSSAFVQLILHACFQQTKALLALFYPTVISMPDRQLLGTPRFLIQISWLCSGFEGLLLVSLLIALWIFFFRRELIISRALLVAPLALVLTWYANIVRLATLIAIGDHGHAMLAGLGFHTQAGWVSLNLIVLGCLAAIQHAAWFRKPGLTRRTQPLPAVQASDVNYVAVYLLPFTLAVAASLLSQGLAEGFEKLYPLRVAVVLFALLLFRKQYRSIDWSFGAPGIITGTVIGFLWLAVRLHHHTITTDDVFTASALSSMTRLHRWMWIAIRVFGATLTVPIAEELAFRGFVARRVERADFETVPYRIMGWLSLAVSSVTFGALHGRMWPAGILTGAALWALARYKNRLGGAVAAHAAANAVIAVAAVLRHDYSLW